MLKQFVSKRTAFAVAALLCCSTLFIQLNARAQCPTCDCPPVPIGDAQYDTTPIPWNPGDTCVYLSIDSYGDTCWVNICYAYRNTTGCCGVNYDYLVTQV